MCAAVACAVMQAAPAGHGRANFVLPAAENAVELDPTRRYQRYPVLLGRGACKTVYKAFDLEDGIEVAWNKVELAGGDLDAANQERLFAEIRVLKTLTHRNIIKFFDWWFDGPSQTINFITEFFTSGTLRQYRKKHKHISEQAVKRWAWQILEGLMYLHAHDPPIVHRDLKCDNILVNGTSGQVKIADLGLASCQRGLSVVGTPEFMAPEIYDEVYDEKVDVYSFGMCMLELATLEYPYSECRSIPAIFRKVSQGIPPAALARVSSPPLKEFISLCISPSPTARPTALQLLKHDFFECLRLESACASPTHAAHKPGCLSLPFGSCGNLQALPGHHSIARSMNGHAIAHTAHHASSFGARSGRGQGQGDGGREGASAESSAPQSPVTICGGAACKHLAEAAQEAAAAAAAAAGGARGSGAEAAQGDAAAAGGGGGVSGAVGQLQQQPQACGVCEAAASQQHKTVAFTRSSEGARLPAGAAVVPGLSGFAAAAAVAAEPADGRPGRLDWLEPLGPGCAAGSGGDSGCGSPAGEYVRGMTVCVAALGRGGDDTQPASEDSDDEVLVALEDVLVPHPDDLLDPDHPHTHLTHAPSGCTFLATNGSMAAAAGGGGADGAAAGAGGSRAGGEASLDSLLPAGLLTAAASTDGGSGGSSRCSDSGAFGGFLSPSALQHYCSLGLPGFVSRNSSCTARRQQQQQQQRSDQQQQFMHACALAAGEAAADNGQAMDSSSSSCQVPGGCGQAPQVATEAGSVGHGQQPPSLEAAAIAAGILAAHQQHQQPPPPPVCSGSPAASNLSSRQQQQQDHQQEQQQQQHSGLAHGPSSSSCKQMMGTLAAAGLLQLSPGLYMQVPPLLSKLLSRNSRISSARTASHVQLQQLAQQQLQRRPHHKGAGSASSEQVGLLWNGSASPGLTPRTDSEQQGQEGQSGSNRPSSGSAVMPAATAAEASLQSDASLSQEQQELVLPEPHVAAAAGGGGAGVGPGFGRILVRRRFARNLQPVTLSVKRSATL